MGKAGGPFIDGTWAETAVAPASNKLASKTRDTRMSKNFAVDCQSQAPGERHLTRRRAPDWREAAERMDPPMVAWFAGSAVDQAATGFEIGDPGGQYQRGDPSKVEFLEARQNGEGLR